MIQHRAACFVLRKAQRRNVRDSVSSMLAELQWPSCTISKAKVCKINLIIHNIVSIPPTYLPVPTPLSSTRSNHGQKFLHYHTSVDCYKFSFFPRTVPEWNDLPARIVQSNSLDTFKEYLHEYIV